MNVQEEIVEHFTEFPTPLPIAPLGTQQASIEIIGAKLMSCSESVSGVGGIDDFGDLYGFPELYKEMLRLVSLTKTKSDIRSLAKQGFSLVFAMLRDHGIERVQDMPIHEDVEIDLDMLSDLNVTPNDAWHDVLRVWHYMFLGKLMNTVPEAGYRYLHYEMQKQIAVERVLCCGQLQEDVLYPVRLSGVYLGADGVPLWTIPVMQQKTAEVFLFNDFYTQVVRQSCLHEIHPAFLAACQNNCVCHGLAYAAALVMHPECIPSMRTCERCDSYGRKCTNIASYVVRVQRSAVRVSSTLSGEEEETVEVATCFRHFEPTATSMNLIPIPHLNELCRFPASWARVIISVIMDNPHVRECITWTILGYTTATMIKSLAFVIKNSVAHRETTRQNMFVLPSSSGHGDEDEDENGKRKRHKANKAGKKQRKEEGGREFLGDVDNFENFENLDGFDFDSINFDGLNLDDLDGLGGLDDLDDPGSQNIMNILGVTRSAGI